MSDEKKFFLKKLMWLLPVMVMFAVAILLFFSGLSLFYRIGTGCYLVLSIILQIVSTKNKKCNLNYCMMIIGYTCLLSSVFLFLINAVDSEANKNLSDAYSMFFTLGVASFVLVLEEELPKGKYRMVKEFACGIWFIMALVIYSLIRNKFTELNNLFEHAREWFLVGLIPVFLLSGFYMLKKIRKALLCWTGITLKLLFPNVVMETKSVLYKSVKVLIYVALLFGVIVAPSSIWEVLISILP